MEEPRNTRPRTRRISKSDAARQEAERFGRRLTSAWKKAGSPGMPSVAHEAAKALDRPVQPQTLYEYHKGHVTVEGMRVEVVAWLADWYGVPVHDLSPRMDRLVDAARGVLARTRWSVRGVENPPLMQGVLALDYGRFHAPPAVVCRCGQVHALRTVSEPCAYCATPTFDEHQVCAQCRDIEALERLSDDVIDLVELTARTA